MSINPIQAKTVKPYHYSILALLVLLACLGLGYIDYETTSIMDLFKPGNIVALFLYFLPAYALSLLFLKYFSRSKKGFVLILYSAFLGTVLGFFIALLSFYIILP